MNLPYRDSLPGDWLDAGVSVAVGVTGDINEREGLCRHLTFQRDG